MRYNWSWPSLNNHCSTSRNWMEAVSIAMGLLRVVGNQAIKKLSFKIEKNGKIVMLAISALNTLSSLVSKTLPDDSISDEEYSLILLKLEAFTRTKTLA